MHLLQPDVKHPLKGPLPEEAVLERGPQRRERALLKQLETGTLPKVLKGKGITLY